MNTRTSSFWLFLLGLFSATQIRVVGSIAIAELIIFLIAPLVFLHDYYVLKHNKFMPILFWAISAMVGCVIASWYNDTPFPAALRGFATAYSVFAIPVVLHNLLRNNIMGYRWMLLGMAISGVITIFGFYNAAELAKNTGMASDTMSDLVGGEIFALVHFGAWPVLPVQGWYLATPTPYAIIAPLILTGYTIIVSASGRSAILMALMASVLIFLGGKTRRKLAEVQKNIIYITFICIVALGLVASLYKYAGKAGLLNKKAQQKYEHQMKNVSQAKGFAPLRMLMAGRLEFFVGLYECLQSPVIGYGPWAIDKDGTYEEFLRKYGDAEDYDNYVKRQVYLATTYRVRSYALIGGHSHILQFWLAYGLLGLPYWLYVIYLIFQFWRRYVSFLPQFYGFLVVFSASFMWDVFFSPFSARIGFSLFITTLLLIRAGAMGRIQIPVQELIRAQKENY